MTAPEWRDCADPDELAAAVAAGVEVRAMGRAGDFPTANQTADRFAGSLRAGITYRIPADWSPEPPDDDLRERIARAAAGGYMRVPIVALDGMYLGPPWLDVADAVLAVLPTPLPVPPWPGAVLSGLCDEDGVPTWLAQAGDVRGEQVRIWHGEPWVTTHGSWADSRWVEVRAPRAVPEPETERVPWYRAPGRRQPGGDLLGPIVQAYPNPNLPGGMYVEYELPEHGTTTGNPNRHPDGMVEVLKDGAR